MCDIQEMGQNPVIPSPDICPEKQMLAEPLTEDERKDDSPEVTEKEDSSPLKVQRKLLQKLSDGVLSYYVNDVKKASLCLNELTRNQNIVIETLEQETTRVIEALKTYRLEDMFSRIKHYQNKAQVLKKDMLAIHERTLKLKKRAMKLQQQKQKEALQKELQRDRELERDKQLAPKIATKPSTGK